MNIDFGYILMLTQFSSSDTASERTLKEQLIRVTVQLQHAEALLRRCGLELEFYGKGDLSDAIVEYFSEG